MDRLGVLTAAFVLSLLAALGAAAQLADYYWYGEDFSLFVLPITIFAAVSIGAFGVAGACVRSSGGLRNVALALAVAAFALTLLTGFVGEIARRSANPDVVLRAHDRFVATAFLLPVLIAIVIQWRVVRRGWLRARGQDHASAWPWITFVVACVVIFSPPGLAIFGAAIAQSATDWLRQLWLTVVLGVTAVLALAGLVEWRIRTRKLGKARAAPPPAP
jgi:hypothetical protein